MIELKNITLKQYVTLKNKSAYDYAMSYSKIGSLYNRPVDHFNIGIFDEQPFGIIKDIQQDLSEGIKWDKMLAYMSELSGKPIKQLYKTSLLELCQVKAYIIAEIQRLVDIENEILSYEASNEERQAGIEGFAVFGVYSQLRALAGGDALKISEVRKMKYVDAFVELCYSKQVSDFDKKLFEIRNKPK